MSVLSIDNVTQIFNYPNNTTSTFTFPAVKNSDGSFNYGKVINLVVLSAGSYNITFIPQPNEYFYLVTVPNAGQPALSQSTSSSTLFWMTNDPIYENNNYMYNAVNTFVSFHDSITNTTGWIQCPIYNNMCS